MVVRASQRAAADGAYIEKENGFLLKMKTQMFNVLVTS